MIGPGILPRGGRMAISGFAKAGKSFVTLNIIRALIQGEEVPFECPYFEAAKTPQKILFIEKEIGPYSIGARLKPILRGCSEEAIKDRFKLLSQPEGFYLSDPSCVAWLRDYCKGEGIDLLVLDPINKLHFFEENKAQDMLRLIDAIQTIQRKEMAVLVIHHNKKPQGEGFNKNFDPLDFYNMRGSRFAEDPDAIIMCNRRPGRLVPVEWDNWRLDCRMTLRHGSSPAGDFQLDVNVDGDFRVHYSCGDKSTVKRTGFSFN